MSTRREDFFSDGRKEKQNASRASNKTRENDQSFAVWPMGRSGGGGMRRRAKEGKKQGGGEIGRTEDTERSWGTRFELNE